MAKNTESVASSVGASKVPLPTTADHKKIYVLDTNVLVYDPGALFNFENAAIVIPAIVLEELDRFKSEATGRGRDTRLVIRHLDELRERGKLGSGIRLDNGGTIQVFFLTKEEKETTPFKIETDGDNEILLTALVLKNKGYDVRFISKDINARVKADAIGIESFDYLKERVSKDSFYRGWDVIQVPAVELKQEYPPSLMAYVKEADIAVNQFVLVESNHNPQNNKVFRYLGGDRFKPVYDPALKWPLKARNPQQLMALDLLMDDSIQLVSLFGPAGTGKTFLSLLVGLHKVLVEREYEKLLVSRPVVPLGKDIGYLPGTLEEKLHSWMLPIYDNMEFIVHAGLKDEMPKGKGKRKGHHPKRDTGGLRPIDDLIYQGKLSLEAITYMRGRSIPYQFIFIDEVQNLSPHEVKTLVSRVGEGSKIILTGDPYQIDSPYLDFSSNGLVVVSERFKGERIFGSVFLSRSERSELSKLVTELL